MKKRINITERIPSARNRVSVSKTSELEYLVDILPQLRGMALSLEEKTLAYLLEMAMLEASLVLDIDKHAGAIISLQERPS